MAEWGGTGFNFTVTADKPRKYWFETYGRSARRFREIAAKAGADVSPDAGPPIPIPTSSAPRA